MPAYSENTLVNSGQVTAPGAGVDIAQITAIPPGVYKVTLVIVLSGTAETALRNLRLREGGTTVADALPTLSAAAGPLTLCFERVEVNDPGGGASTDLDVIAIAAGTAGAVYSVVLTATRVG